MAPRKRRSPSPVTAAFGKEILEERARRRDAVRDPSSLDRLTELNSVDSPLLRLPAEIRNMIFTYVFSGEEYLLRRHDYSTLICGEAVTDINMSLLLVSRQAYSETALLPYKLGTICFRFNPSYISWQADIEIFLEERSAEQIEAIACLESGSLLPTYFYSPLHSTDPLVHITPRTAQHTKLSRKCSTMPSCSNGQPPAKKRRFEGAEERAAIRRLRERAPRDKM
ncbi:hypothetical protein J4E86_007974 [Alternaria arbusti]|uniref:uncharacterized protein n=1 Tax=Alternaria arbusti TaxID=232088 RepID=UPI00222118DD|nr:uncharacterized protein J4E86_007974 [Alternaria arbusti]KAI4948626.1 hypothetical protein J4E86_007974 [Alternaria arbusti]